MLVVRATVLRKELEVEVGREVSIWRATFRRCRSNSSQRCRFSSILRVSERSSGAGGKTIASDTVDEFSSSSPLLLSEVEMRRFALGEGVV
jgi:hypothetical protein